MMALAEMMVMTCDGQVRVRYNSIYVDVCNLLTSWFGEVIHLVFKIVGHEYASKNQLSANA
jgi:hypothetical protein